MAHSIASPFGLSVNLIPTVGHLTPTVGHSFILAYRYRKSKFLNLYPHWKQLYQLKHKACLWFLFVFFNPFLLLTADGSAPSPLLIPTHTSSQGKTCIDIA